LSLLAALASDEAQQLQEDEQAKEKSDAPHVVVIGGGWAGYGAAEALSPLVARGLLRVTLLEASPRGGGLAAGWRTPKGRPVEAGLHGFWRNYRNIDALVGGALGLGTGTGRSSPFTPFTKSTLFTARGRSVVAPVLGDTAKLRRLPAPLGPAIYSEFGTLGLGERLAAALPLGLPWLDFDGGPESWERYDDATAEALLKGEGAMPGLSGILPGGGAMAAARARLYDEFLEPMLLVLPMAPGHDVSAAAALSCFSFFALEHQGDFDVRWLRGSATELIFEPWRKRLTERGVNIRDGARAQEIRLETDHDAKEAKGGDLDDLAAAAAPRATPRARGAAKPAVCSVGVAGAVGGSGGAAGDASTNDLELVKCDAVISAISISATQGLVRSSNSHLAALPEFQRINRLRPGIGCVAVRLWLSRPLPTPLETPSNVAGAHLAPGLGKCGFTFYHLNELQDQFRDERLPVLEVDFYNASPLLAMGDAAVLRVARNALANACPESFEFLRTEEDGEAKGEEEEEEEGPVQDFAVVRVGGAVSHFAPGTFRNLPPLEAPSLANFFFAGDWVDRGGHRSWSQEKALVTGYQAAQKAARQLLPSQAGCFLGPEGVGPEGGVLEVEPDEPQVAAGRQLLKQIRAALGPNAGRR